MQYILNRELNERDRIDRLETDKKTIKDEFPKTGVFLNGTLRNVFDLVPNYPLRLSVFIKERKAPLMIRIDYFD